MKNNYTYYVFKNTITINIGVKTITIHKDDPRFDKVLQAIESNELDTIPTLADNENKESIRHLLKLGNKSRVNKE